MPEVSFTVVIPTYNRSQLIGRAIRSAMEQNWTPLEILVVDDASTDATKEIVKREFPCVRYLSLEKNSGVGAARNRGICEATMQWVVCLDDDDTLVPGALCCIADRIKGLVDVHRYPVIQFPRTNGCIPSRFLIATMEDYAAGNLVGDFVPVIRRDYFLAERLAYPEFHSGAEGLLWLRVASKYGIPTWNDQLQQLGVDAPTRMMSIRSQLRYAHDHAQVGESILREFGVVLKPMFPDYYHRKLVGTATYWILAGNGTAARSHLRAALRQKPFSAAIALWGLSYMPRGAAKKFFMTYRKHVNGWET